MKQLPLLPALFLVLACRGSAPAPTTSANVSTPAAPDSSARSGTAAALPLVLVADVALPGRAVRFDYQDLDLAKGLLVIAHMNDDSVVIVNSSDGSLVKVL